MLKGTLSSFHAVKHLCNVFQATTLLIVKYKTLASGYSGVLTTANTSPPHLIGRGAARNRAIVLRLLYRPSYAGELKFLPYPPIRCFLSNGARADRGQRKYFKSQVVIRGGKRWRRAKR